MAKYIGSRFKMLHGNADEFGKYYNGSIKARQAKRMHKKLAKQK